MIAVDEEAKPSCWGLQFDRLTVAYAWHMLNRRLFGRSLVKRSTPSRRQPARKAGESAKMTSTAIARRAAIFRNGRNQAVRLPQDLKFPDRVKEVEVRKRGDTILLSPVRPDWASFFSLGVQVAADFLTDRDDLPPQQRDPL